MVINSAKPLGERLIENLMDGSVLTHKERQPYIMCPLMWKYTTPSILPS